MMKCHCNAELKLKVDEKSGEIWVCPKCQCTFRFCLIRWIPKCYAKFHKEEAKASAD